MGQDEVVYKMGIDRVQKHNQSLKGGHIKFPELVHKLDVTLHCVSSWSTARKLSYIFAQVELTLVLS